MKQDVPTRTQLTKINQNRKNPVTQNAKLSKMIRIQEKCPKITQIEPKLSKFARTQFM